jgi:hypothetical protein
MPLAGFQPSILERDQPQSHTLDRKVTGIGPLLYWHVEISRLYYLNISINSAPTHLAVQEGTVVQRSEGGWGVSYRILTGFVGPFGMAPPLFFDKRKYYGNLL